MQRRSFIKNSGMAGLAIAALPQNVWASPQEFSTEELMGKADIELFGEGINLRKEAHDAFVKMRAAAEKDGFAIQMVSSFRDFYRQQSIWERKYIRYTEDDGMQPMEAIEKIIQYSTIPGTSRHHWGTDIDIIDGNAQTNGDVLVPEKFEKGGPFEGFKLWLDENAEKFDFHLVYTNDPRRKGFKYEPWHYSYAPLAIPMLTAYRKLNVVKLLSKEDFLGCDHFTTGFLKTYIQDNILDINQDLL
ncbi:MAG: D-alanyl-D-alanine carboxypeptidase [Muricauda sp.]|nr:M15 family metallopeptidase [Allomuricauda sp.]MAU26176.1 D-alanyl-D-alanine carboxypeptidase [Allomuricauda sp.]MBC32128.1 D-alanyl-D-alanine carboxypeptidase [Allomuricauda sp.]|tara:strand:- start:45950 stop:46684 length:735 start_codon:yes stop_codon:yes gene_type:complete